MENKEFIIQITKGTITYSNSSAYATAGTTLFGITIGSMSIESCLCSDEFNLGECNSSKFEVQLFNLSVDVTGASIIVGYIENNIYTTIFSGIVDSSTTDRENFQRTIIAYDKMYYVRDKDVATAWTGTGVWPSTSAISLKTIRENLCAVVGLSTDTNQATLPNDDITFLPKFASVSSVSFSTLLKMICELQACFPVVIGDTIKFIQLDTVDTAIDGLYDTSGTEFEDYNTVAIDAINIYSTSNDLSQTVKAAGVTTPNNAYAISGNIFILSMSATDITTYVGNVLNAINSISYNPASITMILGDLSYSLGQKLTTTRDGITYTHYIFSNALSGPQLITQTIECPANGELLNGSVSTQNNSIIEGQRYSKLRQDVDSLEFVAGSRNKIWKQATQPTDVIASVGDLWYVTGTEAPTGYKLGKWYYCSKKGVWEETTDSTITEHTATLELQSTEIAAKVSNTGGKSSSFAWTLTESGFTLTSNDSTVFNVTSAGAEITGKITATSGIIGAEINDGTSTKSTYLYVNTPQTIGGESSTSSTSGTYLMYDTNNNLLQLSTLRLGMANNLFYLGDGGLVLRNTDGYSSSNIYDALRVTCSGLAVTGRLNTSYGQSAVRYSASGIQFSGYTNTTGSLMNTTGTSTGEVVVEWRPSTNTYNKSYLNMGASSNSYLRFGNSIMDNAYTGTDTNLLYGKWALESNLSGLTSRLYTTTPTSTNYNTAAYICGNANFATVTVTSSNKTILVLKLFTPLSADRNFTVYYTLSGSSTLNNTTIQIVKGSTNATFTASTTITSWGFDSDSTVSSYDTEATYNSTSNVGIGMLANTWYGSTGYAISSWRYYKENISNFSDRYDTFYDNLKPRTFKYTTGNRTHYGFILDEVRSAMYNSNMNTDDCAAYCLYNKDDENGPGGIRYEEFIALNTWQIQKLKARIAEIEKRIEQ